MDLKKATELVIYITELAENYFFIEDQSTSAILNISKEDKEILNNCFGDYPHIKSDVEKEDKMNTVYGSLYIVERLSNGTRPIITPKH